MIEGIISMYYLSSSVDSPMAINFTLNTSMPSTFPTFVVPNPYDPNPIFHCYEETIINIHDYPWDDM